MTDAVLQVKRIATDARGPAMYEEEPEHQPSTNRFGRIAMLPPSHASARTRSM